MQKTSTKGKKRRCDGKRLMFLHINARTMENPADLSDSFSCSVLTGRRAGIQREEKGENPARCETVSRALEDILSKTVLIVKLKTSIKRKKDDVMEKELMFLHIKEGYDSTVVLFASKAIAEGRKRHFL